MQDNFKMIFYDSSSIEASAFFVFLSSLFPSRPSDVLFLPSQANFPKALKIISGALFCQRRPVLRRRMMGNYGAGYHILP